MILPRHGIHPMDIHYIIGSEETIRAWKRWREEYLQEHLLEEVIRTRKKLERLLMTCDKFTRDEVLHLIASVVIAGEGQDKEITTTLIDKLRTLLR